MAGGELERWNDGEAKSQILEFVRSVTEPGGSFVPPAAFTTCWTVRPVRPGCSAGRPWSPSATRWRRSCRSQVVAWVSWARSW